ncbi:hypothetical protein C7I36_12655 [Zobellella taiwanensis]|uniref:Type IV pilin n=1 Tax=Zobellella taiwanensis TaxID=347535 RepID=A0A2P7QMX2_9GAMM|nr:prepilin-type N-terminal cleavage/methylation domain-containing protein [Zobellella taiwanensis]PSJ39295.1 hypothetical protein C7I36_12655 [Zobellella taiwanensis]
MRRQSGFGLLEVMIAFILVAVTAGTLLQLNKVYLEYSRDGRYREVAMRLAESKLDELRGFDNITDYQAIVGSSAPESVQVDDTDYAIEWEVTDYGWDGSAWVTPPPSGVASGKKEIEIAVGWSEPESDEVLLAESVLSPNLSISSGPFGTGSGNAKLGLGGPDVAYTPGEFPMVIPIELGNGMTQETTKPLPDIIKKGQSIEGVRVTFDTFVYDENTQSRVQQDLVTVSCNCQLDGSGTTQLPAQRALAGDYVYWKKGEAAAIAKPKGKVANNDQDPLCVRCCERHFDGSSGEFSNWYDAFKYTANNQPHEHYPSSSDTPVSGTQTYLEACRFIRIDGFFEVAQDWNLIAFNILDDGLFTNVDFAPVYQGYVRSVVVDYIDKQLNKDGDFPGLKDDEVMTLSEYLVSEGVPSSPFSTTDISISPMSRQLMARGVYVDLLSEELRLFLQEKISADSNIEELLNYVPFYEVNLTLLADWLPVDGNKGCSPYPEGGGFDVLCVTSQDIPAKSGNNKDGIYSRGRVSIKSGVASGTARVTANIRRSNSGITSFKEISPFEFSYIRSSYLDIKIGAFGDFSNKSSISSALQCKTYELNVDGEYDIVACSEEQFSSITVSYSGSGGCLITPVVGNLEGFYNCFVDPNAGDVTVTPQYNAGIAKIEFLLSQDNPVSVTGTDPVYVPGPCITVVLNRPDDPEAALPDVCGQ